MKVVVQRVSSASVMVGNEITGVIEKGLLLLVGIHQDDTEQQMKWMCEKILKLRVFEDEDKKMNLSVTDVKGELLVVSQFTLYGDTKKGTRPSYIEAARPEKAEPMYEEMIQYFKDHSDLNIQTGKFGAMMDVKLINDGPVTLILEK
ncbi:MAG: D-tyrosyl-tRNA(Tyr) deacylase [Balneolaceae bacterium]|nr:D-tyrosyl-tRNA(Tyr) deacylase [Balneolaceae bacterium]MBO6545574.1 D-tyrosyl-tRNA(Tyr) deacylase [Balneolaceae bacterium]MBO6646970.1 D-tyrosyl-tRNA(Tyr) deacylase [Balneolaceae bacterium]